MTAKNLDGHILVFEDAGGRQYGVPAEAVCIGSFTVYAHDGQFYTVPVSARLVGQGNASSGNNCVLGMEENLHTHTIAAKENH